MDNQMIIERLKDALEIMGLSQTDAANRIGVRQQNLSLILNGKRPFGKNMQHRVESMLGISANWLLTGEGNMLKTEQSNARLVSGVYSSSYNDEGISLVDFVPVSVHATFVESLEGDCDVEIEKMPIVAMSHEKAEIDRYKVFEVEGESMLPSLKPGALILAKEIPDKQWHYAEGVVVCVFSDFVVVKRIALNDLMKGNSLLLRSDNEAYGEMQIPLSDIRAIYKAKRIISSDIV